MISADGDIDKVSSILAMEAFVMVAVMQACKSKTWEGYYRDSHRLEIDIGIGLSFINARMLR